VIDGLAIVDKPAGWTSHDVVARCRRIFGQKRIGHAGTLDPGATGVLLVGLGQATRLLRFVAELVKCYEGEIVLGTETSTLDDEGEVVAVHQMSDVALDDVRTAAERFVGEIDQVPPMVSAVKVGGRRLHELARQGLEVERPARRVRVDRFQVAVTPEPSVYRIDVECSSGTYVRVLAADVGRALGGGAHLRHLRRTSIGPFALDRAAPLDALGPDSVLPPATLVAHLASCVVDADLAAQVAFGRVLGLQALGAAGEGPWAVLDERSELLAVYERYDADRAKPAVVLTASAAGSGDTASAAGSGDTASAAGSGDTASAAGSGDTASGPGSLNDPGGQSHPDRSENEGAADR
jgi:tRNA pseudouridine55 synthase